MFATPGLKCPASPARAVPGVANAHATAAARRICLRMVARRSLVAAHRSLRFLLEIGVRRRFGRDTDALDRSAMELAGCLVLGADGVAAVVADAEPVTGQRELARLRL